MAFEINLVAGKDSDFTGTIKDANGNAITLTAASDVLMKIYRGNPGAPDLDLNGTALAGGSVTSFNTASSGANQGLYTVKFFGADTSGLNIQTYDAEITLVDAGDGSRLKEVDRGVVNVLGTTSGKTT